MMRLEYLTAEQVKCSCGCGEIAEQILLSKGLVIAIPKSNPVTHYKNYKRRREQRQTRQLDEGYFDWRLRNRSPITLDDNSAYSGGSNGE